MINIRQRSGKIRKGKLRLRRGGKRKGKAALKSSRAALPPDHNLGAQLASTYNQGYDAGYDDALRKHAQASPSEAAAAAAMASLADEYNKGLYNGGEGMVDELLSDTECLPDLPVRQIIEAGIAHLSPRMIRLLSAHDVFNRMMNALQEGNPLSVIRLGDGELLALAQEVALDEAQVRSQGHFLNYAGIQVPDLSARDQLAQAVRTADIVGIPKLRLPNFQPLAFTVFKVHGISYQQLQLSTSTINYALYLEGYLKRLLVGRRVLLVGNTAHGLGDVMGRNGIHVARAIAPVHGIHDIPRVMNEIAGCDFDIALVSAGIPAVIIAQRIARDLGRVALDFGHLADAFIKGEAQL